MLKASKQSEKILMDYYADNNKYLNGNICNNPDIAGDYKQLIIHNAFYGKAPLTVNNSFEIFTSGKDKFKSLFNEIENAKKSICSWTANGTSAEDDYRIAVWSRRTKRVGSGTV